MGWSAFVGVTYLAPGSDRLDEYLDDFIDRAIDPDEVREGSLSGEEEYLQLFIAHSLDDTEQYEDVVASGSSYSGPDIKYSKFVHSNCNWDF